MRLALAQTRATTADIEANVLNHIRMIERAAERGAGFVAFPELSLTGYEPTIGRRLSIGADDPRLDALQRASDSRGVTIAVGAPLRAEPSPHIGVVVVAPHSPRRVLAKQHLHIDEHPFFSAAPVASCVLDTTPRIGVAICFELSVPDHAERAFGDGAGAYLATVAKSADGVTNAHPRLAEVARNHHAPVLMVNCVGRHDGTVCAGGTAAWTAAGELVTTLDAHSQALLLVDLPSATWVDTLLC